MDLLAWLDWIFLVICVSALLAFLADKETLHCLVFHSLMAFIQTALSCILCYVMTLETDVCCQQLCSVWLSFSFLSVCLSVCHKSYFKAADNSDSYLHRCPHFILHFLPLLKMPEIFILFFLFRLQQPHSTTNPPKTH
jgi:hypothetical protein